MLKKAVGWALGGLLALYVSYLTVSGAIAGAADAHAVKLAKSAVYPAPPPSPMRAAPPAEGPPMPLS